MILRVLLSSYIFIIFGCKSTPVTYIHKWKNFDESELLASVAEHKNPRMRFKLIQSKVSDKNEIWKSVADDISLNSEEYEKLYPLIFEKNILEIQAAVESGDLSYEKITQWYLFRILKFENDSTKTLNTIIALNPNAVEEAKERDRQKAKGQHPIYGLPVLLKDNINTAGMATTAGAIVLKDNQTDDAHIVKQLKANGAIILGKVNLSEWAYYFCGGCPVGYSAIGGQTLNPYGRGVFETGGSSAGSGTSMAANYAVAAVGTETSGSILSPSGQNSVVGLKPTIGLLSRTGIVPISSTLDTPGPMTRNVTDNAILLSAMTGFDPADDAMRNNRDSVDYLGGYDSDSLSGKRFGVIKSFLQNPLLQEAVLDIKKAGAVVIELDLERVSLPGFRTLLSADMKRDLPKYLEAHASENIEIATVSDVIQFNLEDTLIRAPYGQVRLEGSTLDTTTDLQLKELVVRLNDLGRSYFEFPMEEHRLDAIISMNNRSAGVAAAAKHPCFTVPMGYEDNGEPMNITFIGRPNSELELYKIGFAFEEYTEKRKPPF